MLRTVLAVFFSVSLLRVPVVFAQATTAQITGVISDSSGSVVPGVSVRVVNADTGSERTATSNGLGGYTVPLLPPGNYAITATKDGFKPVTRSGLTLQVDQVARVDFTMEIGALTETIEVVSTAPLLAQQTSSLGQVIDNTKILNIPLNGRSPFRLVLITPGVLSTPAASGQFGDVSVNTNQDSDFSVNGGQSHSAEVMIDGVPATAGLFNSMTTIPSVDSTQEFKVESNNLSAEWGRFSGGVVNVSTRSGTNELHGTLFEFLRNSALDTNDFFNNRAGKDKPPFRMNQFGFAVGGPLALGRLYNGHNRTFFFADYQGTRWVRGDVFSTTVPTPVERAGDFTQSLTAAGLMQQVYDPLTTRPNPANPAQYIRDPFAGNVIPASRIDPVAQKMIAFYPLPNTAGNPVTHANNFVSNAPRTIGKNEFSGRLDHQVRENYRLFARYSFNKTDLTQPDYFDNAATPGAGNAGIALFHYHTAVFDNTVLLSPRTILNLRYGFARWYQNRPSRSYGFDQRQIGMPESTVRQFQIPTFPQVTVENYSGMAGNTYLVNGNDNHSFLPSLTWVAGRHNIKTGADLRLRRINLLNIGSGGGAYTFNRIMTRGPDPTRVTANGGNGIASFLLGTASAGSANTIAGVSMQDVYAAGYFQDDVRIRQNLTLNLGLRYETETPYTERHDQLVWFDSSMASPVRNASFPNLNGGLVFAGMNGNSRRVYSGDYNNVAPRVGLSWSISNSTVFRAGAGLFYAPLEISPNNTGLTPSYGFSSTTPFLYSLDGLTPFHTLRNPYPDGLVSPTRTSLGNATYLGQSFDVWDNDARTPQAWQWNADLQRRLPGDFLIDVAYSANRGIHLARTRELNALPPQYMAMGTGLQALRDNPFASSITTGTLSQPRVSTQQLLLPYPQYTGISVINSPSGNSIYHSMQIKVEKRMARGAGFLLSYTAGKLISDTPKALANFGSYNQTTAVQNWYNLSAERSVSEMDVSQSLAFSYVVELPFGPKRKFLGGVKGVPGKLLEGWNLGGLFTARTGFPLAVYGPTTNPVTLGGTRPNSTGRSAKISESRSRGQKIDRWFDTTAFTAAPSYTFGNLARTLPDVRGPNIVNLDTALIKDTRFTERVQLQFRAESFNLFNTPQFWLPNTTFGNVQFGQISQTLALPRVLQFSLKLRF